MTSEILNAKVTVWFTRPVSGVDQTSGDDFTSDRHIVLATQVTQDLARTTFVDNNGEVVAEWPTDLIKKIEWSSLEVELHVGSIAWRQKMQARYPKAYEPWSVDEDNSLRAEAAQGLTVKQMVKSHERGAGAIRARLLKLGLRD